MENPAEKVLIKTSIIGKLNNQGSMKRYSEYRFFAESYGFTLVELLVVIVLMGVILVFAVPTTRDVLTGDNLKKASRQLIGMEKKLRVEAVRDQMNYILCLDLPKSAYWVVAADMTPEKQDEIKKRPHHLPSGVVILDIVGKDNKKQSADEVRIKFGKKNICSPAIIHLAYEENKMTMVINPFLGVTDVYDKYVDIPVTGSGQSNTR
jgi:prepilin-type N-terminal cleavage/methylation domain-containing protein